MGIEQIFKAESANSNTTDAIETNHVMMVIEDPAARCVNAAVSKIQGDKLESSLVPTKKQAILIRTAIPARIAADSVP